MKAEQRHTDTSFAGESSRAAANHIASLWLDHAAIMTADLEHAVEFYSKVLGLRVNIIEADPIRRGRRRAMLFDSNGRDVLEIIEMSEMKHRVVPGRGAVHHLGFRFPGAEWKELRLRLDTLEYPYEIVSGRLFVRDADGLILEIEPF